MDIDVGRSADKTVFYNPANQVQIVYDTNQNYYRIQNVKSGDYLNNLDEWVQGGDLTAQETHFRNIGHSYGCIEDAENDWDGNWAASQSLIAGQSEEEAGFSDDAALAEAQAQTRLRRLKLKQNWRTDKHP